MTIDQITDTVRDQEARDHIRRQYQSDLQVFGERKALEFARFRCAALAADANEQAARQAKQSFRRALIIGVNCAAALAFAIGFMIGRAV